MTSPGTGVAFSGAFVLQKKLRKCPKLQRCNWIQLSIDSEGNDQEHEFVIREEARRRVVTPVMQWWMTKHYKNRHGGPLPDDMVKENAYWERYTWDE
jgi:hypothetical protein